MTGGGVTSVGICFLLPCTQSRENAKQHLGRLGLRSIWWVTADETCIEKTHTSHSFNIARSSADGPPPGGMRGYRQSIISIRSTQLRTSSLGISPHLQALQLWCQLGLTPSDSPHSACQYSPCQIVVRQGDCDRNLPKLYPYSLRCKTAEATTNALSTLGQVRGNEIVVL